MLRSHLLDYSDAYFAVKGKIIVTNPDNDAYDKKVAFKNNAPFNSCTLKINNTLIDNAEDFREIIEKELAVYGIITEMNQIVMQ